MPPLKPPLINAFLLVVPLIWLVKSCQRGSPPSKIFDQCKTFAKYNPLLLKDIFLVKARMREMTYHTNSLVY